MDFLAGIPGTIGGAVATNAGSKDVWLSHRLVELRVLAPDLREIEFGEGDVEFGYRHCGLDREWIVTGAVLAGYRCSVEEARRGVEEHLGLRRASQPIGEATAGCVFKNPPGQSAGALIDRAGLKGLQVGGAKVSDKHANFIVAQKGCKSADVLRLMDAIQERVREQFDIELAPEIEIWK